MMEPYTNNPNVNLNLAALCSQACRRFLTVRRVKKMMEPYTNNPNVNRNLAPCAVKPAGASIPGGVRPGSEGGAARRAPHSARARCRAVAAASERARVPARGGSKGRGREGSEEAATIAAPSLTPPHPPTGLRRARGRASASYGGADG